MTPAVRDPWDYPDCPECESELFVEGSPSHAAEFVCHGCGTEFGGVASV